MFRPFFWRRRTWLVIAGLAGLVIAAIWLRPAVHEGSGLDSRQVGIGLGIFICIAFLWLTEALPLAATLPAPQLMQGTDRRNVAWMAVGLAALTVGLLIGGDAGSVVAITGGVLSVFDTTSQVLVTRPQALVATAPAHEIKRVSPGLMSDRWQIGTASVLVPRSRRGDLERWRALAAPA